MTFNVCCFSSEMADLLLLFYVTFMCFILRLKLITDLNGLNLFNHYNTFEMLNPGEMVKTIDTTQYTNDVPAQTHVVKLLPFPNWNVTCIFKLNHKYHLLRQIVQNMFL